MLKAIIENGFYRANEVTYNNGNQLSLWGQSSELLGEGGRNVGSKIARFCGLPPADSFVGLLKDLSGWHKEDSPDWQKWLNYLMIKPIIMFSFGLLGVAFRFARNVVKLATEFLPYLLGTIAHGFFNKLSGYETNNPALNALKYAGLFVLSIFLLVSWAWHSVGVMLTSPLRKVQWLWQLGERYKESKYEIYYKAAAIFSGLFSAVLWATIAPIAFHYCASFMLAHMPQAVMPLYNMLVAGCNWVGSLTASILPTLGNIINTAISYVTFGVLDKAGLTLAAMGLSAAEVGLSGVIGVIALAVGSTYSVIHEKVTNWYHSRREYSEAAIEIEIDAKSKSKNDEFYAVEKDVNKAGKKVDKAIDKVVSFFVSDKKEKSEGSKSELKFKKQ